MKLGEYIFKDEPIILNEGRRTITLKVVNTGDRAVQVGSHYHFFEVNRQMKFDRAKAYGYRLDIPAGTAIRFEPGETHEVTLVELAGRKIVHGMNGLCNCQITELNKPKCLFNAKLNGFLMEGDE